MISLLKILGFLGLVASQGLAAPKPVISYNSTVDQMFAEFQNRGAKNIEDALNLLDPQFFAAGNFELFFESRSIQPSSKKFPRVILFGQDAKLRIGFNHRLGEDRALEIIQYREDRRSWEFREIGFVNGKVKFSKPNPGLCLQCHGGSQARPNLLHIPAVSNFRDFEKQPYWREFLQSVKQDKIYSRLELPFETRTAP